MYFVPFLNANILRSFCPRLHSNTFLNRTCPAESKNVYLNNVREQLAATIITEKRRKISNNVSKVKILYFVPFFNANIVRSVCPKLHPTTYLNRNFRVKFKTLYSFAITQKLLLLITCGVPLFPNNNRLQDQTSVFRK